MTDWQAWHAAYDDSSTSLARRLAVVRWRVTEALELCAGGSPLRILSLCSGDGRDLLPVLAESRRPIEMAVLVENDVALAEAARESAAKLRLETVTVLTIDAGDPAAFAFALPVDLLLLCGIFGNVSEADIRTTVTATLRLLADSGTVIWTRGSTDPDLRSSVRGWFEQAGLHEAAFDCEPEGFGVGVATKPSGTIADSPLPARLFRFVR